MTAMNAYLRKRYAMWTMKNYIKRYISLYKMSMHQFKQGSKISSAVVGFNSIDEGGICYMFS